MRTMKRLGSIFGGVVAASCLAGCMTDDAVEPTNETTQAITDWMYAWYSGTDVDLGSDADKTCFLVGVKGSLRGWTSWSSSEYTTAKAGVYSINGHWRIRTDPGSGPGVAAKVGCIPNVGNRVFVGGSPTSTGYVDDTPSRQCFLTAVSGHGHGWTALLPEQPNNPPGVAVWSDGAKWRILANLIEHSNGDYSGGATAVCVDVALPRELDFQREGPGSFEIPIPSTVVDQYTCGFHMISGVFDDGLDERGLELWHNGSPDWLMSVHTNYAGRAHCVRSATGN